MKTYEKPNAAVVNFDVENSIMNGSIGDDDFSPTPGVGKPGDDDIIID